VTERNRALGASPKIPVIQHPPRPRPAELGRKPNAFSFSPGALPDTKRTNKNRLQTGIVLSASECPQNNRAEGRCTVVDGEWVLSKRCQDRRRANSLLGIAPSPAKSAAENHPGPREGRRLPTTETVSSPRSRGKEPASRAGGRAHPCQQPPQRWQRLPPDFRTERWAGTLLS